MGTPIDGKSAISTLTGAERVPLAAGVDDGGTGVTAIDRKTTLTKIKDWIVAELGTIYATIVDFLDLEGRVDNLEKVTSSLILYLDHSSSDISGYEQLLRTPLTTTLVTETVTINSNTILIDSYATILDFPGDTTIPAGVWTMHGNFQFSSVTGDNYIHWDVYKRTSLGVETLLFRMSSLDITSTNEDILLVQAAQSEVDLADGDRFVLKIYAETTGSSKTASMMYSNGEKFGFIQPPAFSVALDHDSMNDVNDAGLDIAKGHVPESLFILINKTQQTLTSSASIPMDIEDGLNAYLALGITATLTLSNLVKGAEGNIIVVSSGTYTLTILPTPYVINDGAGVVSLTASGRDILSYYYDGTNLNITYGSNYTNA